jgi:hypothetical protein
MSLLYRILSALGIVDDTPDDLVACVDCRDTDCDEERSMSCERRLVSIRTNREMQS